MSFVFLCTPYRSHPGGRDDAAEEAAKAAAAFARAKIPVFAPIPHSHTIAMNGGLSPDSDLWYTLNEPFMRLAKCAVIVELEGWEDSEGIEAEVILAEKLAIPVLRMRFGAPIPWDVIKLFKGEPKAITNAETGRFAYGCPDLDQEYPVPNTISNAASMHPQEVDLVNHPPHYKSGGMEAIDVIDAFSADNYHRGNAIKYLLRAGKKAGLETDLRKAIWYIERELSR